MRLKAAGLLAPVGLLAAVAAIAMPASSSLAASGSQVITANVALNCTLAPGVLNVKGTVNATLSGTVAQSYNPGDTASLTNVTTSLTTPAAWSSSFASLGAATASGNVTSFVLDGAGTTPSSINAATVSPFGSAGLPFGPVTVVSGQPLTLSIPNTGPFTVGPITVSGAPGSNVTISVDSAANGIVASASGFDSSNNLVVGPLTIDCTAPAGATLGSVPIVGTTTTTASSTTTAPPTTSTTTTTTHPPTTTTTSVQTTSTSQSTLTLHFTNWTLSGTLKDTRLGQTITLPKGATFNGSATIPGTLTGDIKVPAFSAKISILGIPTTVGLTLTETGPATGTIVPDPSGNGNLVIKGAAKANIGITAVGILGLNIPVSCATSNPVTFGLNANLPALDLTTGATFTGTTTLPSVRCGGFLGGLLSPVLTLLFSGPNNPYSLTIAPPASS
jgi:hypothetical protein